jgi:hypothetical protein
VKRVAKKRAAKVVPLRPEDPGDIFAVFRSWGYEIYVGEELCKGDVLEAVRRVLDGENKSASEKPKPVEGVGHPEGQRCQGADGISEPRVLDGLLIRV